MTHRTSVDIEAPPVHHAPHKNMNSMSSDTNEHPPHPDSSPLSSTTKGKKKTVHHHVAHHSNHSSHKKHRSGADMEVSPPTLESSPVNESNVVSTGDVPASSTKKTKGHHHHHKHSSQKMKHGTPEDGSIVLPEMPHETSQVETNAAPEDQVSAAAPKYDVESPPPIDAPKAIVATKASTQVQEESPDEPPTSKTESKRKSHDRSIAMDTKKVHPTPSNLAASESQPDIQSPHGNQCNCMANTSIILGIISLFFFRLIVGVLAIVFAIVAFNQLKSQPHRFNDKGTRCIATTGMTLGMVGILIWLIMLLVFV